MTNESQPPPPHPLRSAIQTHHPQIADEIEGAIKTLRKLKEIATFEGNADSSHDLSGRDLANVAMTLALDQLPSRSGSADRQASDATQADPSYGEGHTLH